MHCTNTKTIVLFCAKWNGCDLCLGGIKYTFVDLWLWLCLQSGGTLYPRYMLKVKPIKLWPYNTIIADKKGLNLQFEGNTFIFFLLLVSWFYSRNGVQGVKFKGGVKFYSLRRLESHKVPPSIWIKSRHRWKCLQCALLNVDHLLKDYGL